MDKPSNPAGLFTVDIRSLGSMPLPGPEVFWMQAWDEWFETEFLMVVARSKDHCVVINTGPPDDLDALNALWKGFHPSGRCQYTRSKNQTAEALLAGLGVDPAEVTHVLFTPLVAYTVGAIELFPNAQYVISRRGWIEDVWAPPHAPHIPREIFCPDDVAKHLLFEARDRLRLVVDGEEIVPGISVWEALVHHRSSLGIDITTEAGMVTVTDAAFSYRNVEENIYLGIGESYAEAMVTYERIRQSSDLLIPLYDPEVFVRHPDGRIG